MLSFNLQVDDVTKANEALAIFRVSSCMGYIKSQYMMGIMNLVGLGVPQHEIEV